MLAGKKNKAYKSYLKFIDALELSDRVVLTGFIPDGQLKWAMQNARAYIYPSLSEGFGLPPLEAMLNGTPVVASNATCIPEVCGEAAAYFDPLDVEDMATAINKVITNEKRRAELIAKGHQQVKKYSWRRMAEETLAVYKEVLKEN
jgi:glycosyltransferase involved in cell wall biosynthesis